MGSYARRSGYGLARPVGWFESPDRKGEWPDPQVENFRGTRLAGHGYAGFKRLTAETG